MAIIKYEQLLPYVQPYVAECPEFVILSHIAEAAARFCERTYIWVFDIDEDVTSEGEDIYDVDVPTGTVLEDITIFEIDGRAIGRVPDEQIAPSISDTQRTPRMYAVYRDAQVRLFPTPDKEYTFRGKAIAKPTLDASGIERFIHETYGRAIASGAIGQLTAIPNKAWTNPALSAKSEREFNLAIDAARVRGNRTINQRIAPRPFA